MFEGLENGGRLLWIISSLSSLQLSPREERQKRKAAAAAEVAWSHQCRWIQRLKQLKWLQLLWDQIRSNCRNSLLTPQVQKCFRTYNVITILFSWNITARQHSTHLQLAGRSANPFAAGCSGSNEVHSSVVIALKQTSGSRDYSWCAISLWGKMDDKVMSTIN